MCFVNIQGLKKSEVFRVLYNAAKGQNRAVLGQDGLEVTAERAKQIVEKESRTNFERWGVKDLYINISKDVLDLSGYNKINGSGLGERVIKVLREKW